MRVHLIANSVVANTIEAASVGDASALFPHFTAVEATEGGPGWLWDGETLTAPVAPAMTTEQSEAARRLAYTVEADPLFFSWQAAKESGAPDQDARRQVWRAKRAEIQNRYPYPGE